MRRISFLCLTFLVLGASACVQQVDPSADIPVVSFKSDIAPMMSANCASTGCHTGGGRLFSLQTYDEVIKNGDVQPGKPHSSALYNVVRKYTGESAMPPKPNERLTDEQIGLIYVWILQGAKDN